MISRSMDILEKFTGKRPVGWLGPASPKTYETPELLAAAGVKYIGDWVYDDEPTTIRTANGPLVALPYTVELNDIPMMIVQHHEATTCSSARSISSTGSTRKARSAPRSSRSRSTRIFPASRIASNISKRSMTMAWHDGDAAHWNGEQILDWYLAQSGGAMKAAE